MGLKAMAHPHNPGLLNEQWLAPGYRPYLPVLIPHIPTYLGPISAQGNNRFELQWMPLLLQYFISSLGKHASYLVMSKSDSLELLCSNAGSQYRTKAEQAFGLHSPTHCNGNVDGKTEGQIIGLVSDAER